MRGSCRQSAPEADLSRRVEAVSQIERADRVRGGVREVEEAPVAAHPVLALRPLVRLLDCERAAGERLARQLQAAEAPAPLCLLEQLDVHLGREYGVRAAHVAVAAPLVVVEVQRR